MMTNEPQRARLPIPSINKYYTATLHCHPACIRLMVTTSKYIPILDAQIVYRCVTKRYFFWRTLFFGKYVILVCLRLSTRMSFMGRLDTPSFVADLNAWIVVLCSEHEEYRETVDLTS